MKFLLDQDVYAQTLRFLQKLGSETALKDAFVVVEAGRHRFRKIPGRELS